MTYCVNECKNRECPVNYRNKKKGEVIRDVKRAQGRCPVGGVDRTGKVDRIDIQDAVETPFWMAIWATEPEREVDVRMSYSDLKVICDLIDKEMETQRHGRMCL